jgi:hypothetical protein
MNRRQGRGDGERRTAEGDREVGAGQEERQRTAEREAGDHTSGTGYRPGVNQRRHEPMPASHHDDPRQETVVRNEGHARDGEQAQPSPRAPSRRAGGRDRG